MDLANANCEVCPISSGFIYFTVLDVPNDRTTDSCPKPKIIDEIQTKTCTSTPMPSFWQGNETNPAPHSHP
jgi:hypothetical protein